MGEEGHAIYGVTISHDTSGPNERDLFVLTHTTVVLPSLLD
jgi:hypothetical protein